MDSVRGGLIFDNNTSNYVNIGSQADIDFAGSAVITVEASIKLDTTAGNRDIAANEEAWALTVRNGKLQFYIYSNGWTYTEVNFTDTASFHHVAGTYDGSNIYVYLDGIKNVGQAKTGNIGLNGTGYNPAIIGRNNKAVANPLDGIVREVRISDSVRYTTNFTPPTEQFADDGNTVRLFHMDAHSGTTVTDSSSNTQHGSIVGSLTWVVYQEEVELADTITLSDGIEAEVSLEKLELADTITLSDSIRTWDKIVNISASVYYDGKLYMVTDEADAKLVVTDLGADPISSMETYELGEANARSIVINETFEFACIGCKNGKVVKVDLNDLNSISSIDTGDTDDIENIESYDEYKYIYGGTDDSNGEVIFIDESTVHSINTDFHLNLTVKNFIHSRFDLIFGKFIHTNFKLLSQEKHFIRTDFRLLSPDYSEDVPYYDEDLPYYDVIIPYGRTDFHVYIDDVEVDDVNLESISIIYSIDNEKSDAKFILGRYHDRPNQTIDGDSSQITNKNKVEITLKSKCIFDGKISHIKMQGKNENIEINAVANSQTANTQSPVHLTSIDWTVLRKHYVDILSDTIAAKKDLLFNSVNLALSSNTSKRGLYDVILDDIEIDNPTVDDDEENPEIFKGVKVDLGWYEKEWFWQTGTPPQAPFGGLYGGQAGGANVPLNIGLSADSLADWINMGIFEPDPNWTYFWIISAIRYWTDKDGVEWVDSFSQQYIGTSLSPITSDNWIVTEARYYKQRNIGILRTPGMGWQMADESINYTTIKRRDIWETGKDDEPVRAVIKKDTDGVTLPSDFDAALFTYYLGNAPYKEITARNGDYSPDWHYEDREDGLYWVRNAGKYFIDYAKFVAAIEYEKMKNINGNILPLTSATVSLTVDAFMFYAISLLTRINITNTTESNVYKNNNGFPLAVKAIEINSKSMKVTLTLDNTKSKIELDALDEQIPDEDDYLISAHSTRRQEKFDPAGFRKVT